MIIKNISKQWISEIGNILPLKKNNIIKEFLRKGGIRCEILNDGKISTVDQINII